MVSRCEWERGPRESRGSATGTDGVGQSGSCSALAPQRERPVKAACDLQPTHIAAQPEWPYQRERCAFPTAFIAPCQESNFIYRGLHSSSVPLFPPRAPPPFCRAQVCVHPTEELHWLVYKASNTKMDQEILVPLSTRPSPHMAVNATNQPRLQETVMRRYCHRVVS